MSTGRDLWCMLTPLSGSSQLRNSHAGDSVNLQRTRPCAVILGASFLFLTFATAQTQPTRQSLDGLRQLLLKD